MLPMTKATSQTLQVRLPFPIGWLTKKIVVAKIDQKVSALFANNQFHFIAKWLNCGFAEMQQDVGNAVTFIGSILTQEPGFWNDTSIRFCT